MLKRAILLTSPVLLVFSLAFAFQERAQQPGAPSESESTAEEQQVQGSEAQGSKAQGQEEEVAKSKKSHDKGACEGKRKGEAERTSTTTT